MTYTNYLLYSIFGKASFDTEKVFYWDKWQKIYSNVDKLLVDIPHKFIKSDQAYIIVDKIMPNGYKKLKFIAAPTGGENIWTLKANEKIATKHLPHGAFVFDTSVYASYSAKETAWENGWDFFLKIKNHDTISDSAFNQTAIVSFSKEYVAKHTDQEIEGFIQQFSKLFSAVLVGQTTRPWRLLNMNYTEKGVYADLLSDRDYIINHLTLDFDVNPYDSWIKISLDNKD